MKSVFWEVDSQHVQMLYMNKVNYKELLVCRKVGHICMHYCTLLLPSLTRHSCGPASPLFLTFCWQKVAFWIFKLNFMNIKIITDRLKIVTKVELLLHELNFNQWPPRVIVLFSDRCLVRTSWVFICVFLCYYYLVCNVNTRAKPLFWTFKTIRVCYT